VENLTFKTLNTNRYLTKPFSVEEVKHAVWDCDSFKSLWPNIINFGFIKDFWGKLKDYFTRFIFEFHGNGKLSKDINNIFIVLSLRWKAIYI